MSDPVPLAEVKARWFGDELHRAEWWADHASRDVPLLVGEVEWLQGEVERLRALLEPTVIVSPPPAPDPGNANEPAPSPEG